MVATESLYQSSTWLMNVAFWSIRGSLLSGCQLHLSNCMLQPNDVWNKKKWRHWLDMTRGVSHLVSQVLFRQVPVVHPLRQACKVLEEELPITGVDCQPLLIALLPVAIHDAEALRAAAKHCAVRHSMPRGAGAGLRHPHTEARDAAILIVLWQVEGVSPAGATLGPPGPWACTHTGLWLGQGSGCSCHGGHTAGQLCTHNTGFTLTHQAHNRVNAGNYFYDWAKNCWLYSLCSFHCGCVAGQYLGGSIRRGWWGPLVAWGTSLTPAPLVALRTVNTSHLIVCSQDTLTCKPSTNTVAISDCAESTLHSQPLW